LFYPTAIFPETAGLIALLNLLSFLSEIMKFNQLIKTDITILNRIAILAIFRNPSSWNARPVVKIDIVKPIPARVPIHNICGQLTCCGSLAILNKTSMRLNKKMPTGFPITKPIITPIAMEEPKDSIILPGIRIAVLANAKSGMMQKFTA